MGQATKPEVRLRPERCGRLCFDTEPGAQNGLTASAGTSALALDF
jgi:hypothetical protein